MRVLGVLFVIVLFSPACTAAICITVLTELEALMARQYPARIWRWNREANHFDMLEALNQSAVCSVDYIDDLTGKTIVISGETMYPYVMLNDSGGVTGYIGDIWTTLEDVLKFKSIYQASPDTAGQALKSGQVQNWLSAKAILSYSAGHYCYSHQIATNSYSLFVLSEGARVSKWWYTSIFSFGLWTMSIIFVVGITGLLVIMYRFKKVVCENYVECDNELAIPSFNFLSVLGVITGQGFQKIPTSWSLRFTIMSAVIMGMFMSCGFSSTLTSFLAIRGNSLPINSLEDVVQKRTHSLCVRNNSGAYFRFRENDTSTAPLKQEWRELVNKNCPDMNNVEDFGSKFCKSGLVYLEAPDIFHAIYQKVRRDDCQIVQIPESYWSLRLAFLHARSATHRHLIDKTLLRLQSAGILKYLERKWISTEKTTNGKERQWNFKPVEYAHIDVITAGLLIMMIVSAIICILENIWFRFQSRRTSLRRIEVPRCKPNNYKQTTVNNVIHFSSRHKFTI